MFKTENQCKNPKVVGTHLHRKHVFIIKAPSSESEHHYYWQKQ